MSQPDENPANAVVSLCNIVNVTQRMFQGNTSHEINLFMILADKGLLWILMVRTNKYPILTIKVLFSTSTRKLYIRSFWTSKVCCNFPRIKWSLTCPPNLWEERGQNQIHSSLSFPNQERRNQNNSFLFSLKERVNSFLDLSRVFDAIIWVQLEP